MSLNWPELLRAGPHELIVSGQKHSNQIEEEKGLNEILFKICSLNFLEISKTSVNVLSHSIKELYNLTALMLYDNKLTSLPNEIGLLKKLKTLDISNNQIKNLPSSIGQLSELQSFNMINNQISSLPKNLSNWTNLAVIKFSFNKFTKFPLGLCDPALKQHLSEIHGTDNEIDSIPDEIQNLSVLKVIDLSKNKITSVPGELADCGKLKTVSLQGNPIKDNRLLKLIEKNPTKQIMQYVAKSCARNQGKNAKISSENFENKGDSEKPMVENGQNGEIKNDKNQTITDSMEKLKIDVPPPRRRNDPPIIGRIEILAVPHDNWFIVNADSAALDDRKFVACIVRNVNLIDDATLKKFLSLQTNLHDTVCGKRKLCVIATHDLAKIQARVRFTKMLPHKIQLQPLNRGGKTMSGLELCRTLNQEAEQYRKEKKRSNYSGIHQYLYLLKSKTHYTVTLDGTGQVITLPPLTNAECTKITSATRDIFIEVTGSKTPDCKKALDTLLYEMMKMRLDENSSLIESAKELPTLKVEPVRIVRCDEDDKLFVVYPSKIDLLFDDIQLVRHFTG